jgi:hypothetical protein
MMFALLRLAGLGACVATGLVSLAAPVYAGEHAHKHEAQHAAPVLKPGQKWVTDNVLQQGMDTIRQAMLTNREAIEKERFSARDYQELAAAVNKEAANIVNNCKLSKEADAAFHSIVLVELMQSTNLMQTAPKVQLRRAGAFAVLQTLRNYGDYFQHPGWEIGQ